MCVCGWVRARARARACVCVRVRVFVRVFVRACVWHACFLLSVFVVAAVLDFVLFVFASFLSLSLSLFFFFFFHRRHGLLGVRNNCQTIMLFVCFFRGESYIVET